MCMWRLFRKCDHLCRSLRIRFVVIYAGVLLFYGMSVSYTNSLLISIEKRFSLNTTQMGGVLAATEIGHIATAIFTAHFFGTRHRPRWICFGTVLMGLALFLFAAPEIIFPASVHPAAPGGGLCLVPSLEPRNMTDSSATRAAVEEGHGPIGPLVVLGIAHVFVGFGSTTPLVLGLPYVDDNVPVADRPLYFGYALFGRLLGPLLGFGLGAICNAKYYDFSRPSFAQNDPRWIGAWYIGFIAVGIGMLIVGTLIGVLKNFQKSINRYDVMGQRGSFFPHSMPAKFPNDKDLEFTKAQSGTEDSAPRRIIPPNHHTQISHSLISLDSWRTLFVDLKRLFFNLAFVCRTTSMFVEGMTIAGIFNFFPKYWAQQFQISQAASSMYGGLIMLISILLGIVAGSMIIKRLKLEPRHVGLILVVPAMILSIGLFISMGLGCETTEIQGLSSIQEFRAGRGTFHEDICDASKDCGCLKQNFDPVCEKRQNTNFYSPCFAGCLNVTRFPNGRAKLYHNCGCAAVNVTSPSPADRFHTSLSNKSVNSVLDLVPGLCPKLTCTSHLYALTAVLVIAVFFEGLPAPGQIMLQFRIVDPDLKNLCAGVTSVLVAAFGLLPAPIFVGAIVDSTCRLWQTKPGGGRGYCLFYDTDQFRWKFFLTGACFKLIIVILDSVVTWKVWHMKFERPLESKRESSQHIYDESTTEVL